MERRLRVGRWQVRPRLSSSGPILTATLVAVAALLLVALAGCSTSVSAGSGGSGGTTGGSSASPTESGTWQTVDESSAGSSSSGSNSTQQSISTSISGAYRVLAACQGGGSLELQLDPGGNVNVQCTPARQEPVRVAGSDSAPPGGSLSLDIVAKGDVAWSDVLVQVRR